MALTFPSGTKMLGVACDPALIAPGAFHVPAGTRFVYVSVEIWREWTLAKLEQQFAPATVRRVPQTTLGEELALVFSDRERA